MPAELPSPKKTALIVDDSTFARRNARRILESMGFTVTEADSGPNAIALFTAEPPDVVLLDMVMTGGMDGQETLERLRSINLAPKIFVVTGDSQTMTKHAVLAAGAAGLIVKPLTEVALRAQLTLRTA